ncbi:MAG: chlorite dismutase family protein [Gemmatimonadaceae bacterium]
MAEESQFVQYLMLRVDPQWRRLDAATRAAGREDFTRTLCAASKEVETFAYSTLGLKAGTDMLLWWKASAPDVVQDLTGALLQTGLGRYCEIAHSLWGITRPSVYTKKRNAQEQALDEATRLKYLIVYPFVKTMDWYLMSREARQGMMNEHMRIGHDFDDVRQVLLYTTGLDDQEFIVAYETNVLERHHELVVALRATEARRYTLRDTPIFTAIHRPLEDVLNLAG